MPRTKLKISHNFAYHIYVRSNNRTSFGLPQTELWGIYERYLYFLHIAFNVRIHAFTLMPNHFHLLCSFPDENYSEAIRYLMTETSRAINRGRGSINHVYGDRHKTTCIQNSHHFAIAMRYVYQNPLKASLTSDLSTYPLTTLSGLLSHQHLLIPILSHKEGLDMKIQQFTDTEFIYWLHQLPSKDIECEIQKAMNRSVFKFRKERGTGKEIQLSL